MRSGEGCGAEHACKHAAGIGWRRGGGGALLPSARPPFPPAQRPRRRLHPSPAHPPGLRHALAQGLLLLLCALGPEEMSEVRLGPLTPHAVRTLRHIREFFNVQFK